MTLKSIHLGIPDSKPFDRVDWFEAFVGNFVLPILETKLIDSFWFSRYQDPKKHARFRIKTKDYSVVKPHVDKLIHVLTLIDIADEERYDGGEFLLERFIGQSQREIIPADRQELIWNFLHASSCLYVDTFSHCDVDKYWYRERNNDRGYNIDGDTMEMLHHLFCNLTSVRPRVELLMGMGQQNLLNVQLIAGHYRRWQGTSDQYVRVSQRVDF